MTSERPSERKSPFSPADKLIGELSKIFDLGERVVDVAISVPLDGVARLYVQRLVTEEEFNEVVRVCKQYELSPIDDDDGDGTKTCDT